MEVYDESQSSKPDGVAMDQDVTLNEGRDAKLPSDFRDIDVDDAGAPDNQKDVDAQQSDSNMAATKYIRLVIINYLGLYFEFLFSLCMN